MKIFKILLAVLVLIVSNKASALSFIRDDEIESYIKEVSLPMLIDAGLAPDSVNFYIVNSPELNAFVAGGQNIFLNTGLITESTDPSMLIGVIAHEIGHISAGHLIRLRENSKDATITNILGYVVGVGLMAAAGGGSADAGIAVATATNQIARRNLLKNNRTYESSADQSAMKYLKSAGYSAHGLRDLMKKLDARSDAILEQGNISRYDLTHPVTDERMDVLGNFIAKNPNLKKERAHQQKFERVVAKLEAFLTGKPTNRYGTYAQTYAAAIASHKHGDIKSAIQQLRTLELSTPNDVHLLELKGQILFENGLINEAVKAYSKASQLSYGQKELIEVSFGKALVAAADYKNGITVIKRALRKDRKLPEGWQALSQAQGRLGNIGESYYALAELFALKNKKGRAKEYIKLARARISDTSPISLQLDDLERSLKKK